MWYSCNENGEPGNAYKKLPQNLVLVQFEDLDTGKRDLPELARGDYAEKRWILKDGDNNRNLKALCWTVFDIHNNMHVKPTNTNIYADYMYLYQQEIAMPSN